MSANPPRLRARMPFIRGLVTRLLVPAGVLTGDVQQIAAQTAVSLSASASVSLPRASHGAARASSVVTRRFGVTDTIVLSHASGTHFTVPDPEIRVCSTVSPEEWWFYHHDQNPDYADWEWGTDPQLGCTGNQELEVTVFPQLPGKNTFSITACVDNNDVA